MLNSFDLFQKPLPTFNIHGRTKMPTATGAVVSFLIFCVVMLYSLTKLGHLIQRHNPQVAQFIERGGLDSSYKFNFHESGIRFAWAVEGFLDSESKEDTRYVKGLARIFYKRNGVMGEKILSYHHCSAEELDKMPPPIEESIGLFEIFRTSETRHLNCLDLDGLEDVLSIWGTETDESNYQRFEFLLLPCNYVHAEI